MNKESQRNGKIELLRFLFSLSVLAVHINKDVWKFELFWGDRNQYSFFLHGDIGVEFFFLVSGYLLAASICKYKEKQNGAGKGVLADSFAFMMKKVRAFWPYHIGYCILMILLIMELYPKKALKKIMDRILSLFLLQSLGLDGNYSSFLGVEWYLSSMIIAMAVMVPLCMYFGDFFRKYVIPICSVIIICYICHTLGGLKVGSYHRILRAFSEMGIGMFCYEVCMKTKEKQLRMHLRWILTIIEFLCYAIVFVYACSGVNAPSKVYSLFILAIAVTISFSQKGIGGKGALFQNQICYFLGAISLPLYLVQNVTREFVGHYFSYLSRVQMAILIAVTTIVVAIISYLLVEWCRNRIDNRRKTDYNGS